MNNRRGCVVVAHPLSADLKSRITHLGPSVDVLYASDLLRQEFILARAKRTEEEAA